MEGAIQKQSYFEMPAFKALISLGWKESGVFADNLIMLEKDNEIILFNKNTGAVEKQFPKGNNNPEM